MFIQISLFICIVLIIIILYNCSKRKEGFVVVERNPIKKSKIYNTLEQNDVKRVSPFNYKIIDDLIKNIPKLESFSHPVVDNTKSIRSVQMDSKKENDDTDFQQKTEKALSEVISWMNTGTPKDSLDIKKLIAYIKTQPKQEKIYTTYKRDLKRDVIY